MTRTARALTALAAILAPAVTRAQVTTPLGSTPPAEVRQLVTFLFQPGRSADARAIYERQLKPVYTGIAALRTFRAYTEAESPEPLDLVVVSSYAGMAGMDSANAALRRTSPSALALYGTLSAMSQWHHDQFIEMMPALSDSASTTGSLVVFESIRVAPGMHAEFETRLRSQVRPAEKDARLYDWSETGRVLVGDGWDYVRTFGIQSLADWHRYQRYVQGAMMRTQFGTTVAARKVIILRNDARLSVR